MRIGFILAAVGLIGVFGILAYWQLVVAEGAYLGQRVVTLLYDQFAPRYDAVKQFNPASDALMLARPVLAHNPAARVLDIATGTGRLPLALLVQPGFTGTITAIDSASRMLAIARDKLAAFNGRVVFERRDAYKLPYPDAAFDVVTCLEALEFFPHPGETLREMVRTLAPDGLLIVSNRIGPDAWKLPGRTQSSAQLARQLTALGLTRVESAEWLVDYDLLTGVKSAPEKHTPPR
jgi:ubiquinone/menaquinone biosynthesis C-methylase UbiE